MPKTTLPFPPGDYAPVADRIALFYSRHPEGRIVTQLVERGEAIVFKALAFRNARDSLPAATGWASERVGDGEINAVACLENTETSAIGRALANLGFTASNRRPSAEEMLKAARERARLINERRVGRSPVTAVHERARDVQTPRLVQDPIEEFWPTDPLMLDVLELLFDAERVGLEPGRVARLRERFALGGVGSESLTRLDRALRRWLDRRHRLVAAHWASRDAGDAPSSELQAHADEVTDLLSLLRAARHSGLRPRRADWIDARVRGGQVAGAALDRLGRRLRRWIAVNTERQLSDLSINGI